MNFLRGIYVFSTCIIQRSTCEPKSMHSFSKRFEEKSIEAIIDEIENGVCTRSTLS